MLALVVICSMCTPAEKQKPGNPVQVRKNDTIAENRQMITTAKNIIRSGDLVLRTGNDLTSFYFKQLNVTDNTYSHCGIASVENGKIYIYHALGGEFNPGQQILHERLESFISPLENDGFGLFRYAYTPPEQTAVMKTADSLYHAGILFDMDFDLATNEKMYCAEFVYKTLFWGSRGRLKPETTDAGFKVGVTTDNLFRNPNCREIGRFVYR